MKKAIIKNDIVPLFMEANRMGELADEVLYGMVVEVTGEAEHDLVEVLTHYNYTGYAPKECLLMVTDTEAKEWQTIAEHVVSAPYADAMAEPKVQAARLAGLPRGAWISVQGSAQDGWVPVQLAGGQKAFMRESHVVARAPHWQQVEENIFRSEVVYAALQYKGAAYRWGGKSHLGIDCSGLVSMAYMLCGCLIFRDASIKPGFPVQEISKEDMKEGDLLFFPGHVAMYIGGGRYVHATGFAGDDGVVVNSLVPSEPDYRVDLAEKITQIGSVF